MGDAIPLELADRPDIEVDGALVARELGLEVEEFRGLMARGKVSVLCERGTGEDAGLYRASFYHQGRRARLVVDAQGRVIDPPSPAGPEQARPDAAFTRRSALEAPSSPVSTPTRIP